MRVALVCPYAWDDPGGVQVHARGLAERLLERGHDVVCLTPSRGKPSQPWVRGVGGAIGVRYGDSVASVSPWPSTRSRVRAALDRFGPDVVHVHEPFAPSASFFAVGWRRAPLVATFHSGVDRSRLYDALGPWLRSRARWIDVRIAVSGRAAGVARRRLGGRYRTIPNGIDVARFRESSAAELGPGTKLLFVGRLHPRKGFAVAVRAFAVLAERMPDLHLVVAGEGVERGATDVLPARVRDRVLMLGRVENEALAPIFAACDIFVAPNTGGESFGIVLAEAMASGLPVVATDIPGYDEIVTSGVDGVLVPPRDPGALAEAVSRLLDRSEEAARLAEAGRRRAAAFDWSLIAEQVEASYRDAVAADAPRLR